MDSSPTPTVENNGRRIGAESSNLNSVAYDVETRALDVWFATEGRVTGRYRYTDVPPVVVTNVLFAPSQGKAFIELVKKGGFSYTKVEL